MVHTNTRQIQQRLARAMQQRRIRFAMIAAAAIVASYGVMAGYLLVFDHHTARIAQRSSSKAPKQDAGAKPPDTSGNAGGNTGGVAGSGASGGAPASVVPPAVPGGLLDLTNWKLTLPISDSNDNDPQEILQPRLGNFALAPFFQLSDDAVGVQFRAPVGGVTTSGSNYPRSELREMTAGGTKQASWSNASETHTMTIRQAITHLPAVRPQLVAGQIHDAKTYVILIRLEGSNLFVEADGDNVGTLDSDYKLGTVFTVQVVAGNGHIVVYYNGLQKADYAKSGSGYYFKAGCYTQSNPGKGDSPSDYGQVVIYDLKLT